MANLLFFGIFDFLFLCQDHKHDIQVETLEVEGENGRKVHQRQVVLRGPCRHILPIRTVTVFN